MLFGDCKELRIAKREISLYLRMNFELFYSKMFYLFLKLKKIVLNIPTHVMNFFVETQVSLHSSSGSFFFLLTNTHI
jgi:hypothetical protein